MKKLMALVLFVSATLSFTACSSDDNAPKRNKEQYEGTWIADKLSYTIPGAPNPMEHDFTDMPGENAVSQADELILTEKTATLTEFFKNSETPKTTLGVVQNGVITFVDQNYTSRTINSATATTLSLTYYYTMRGATLPITVTYKRLK
ncbi:hypothetical protein [Myroides odoratimimus]|nr:hypothetical protein [Myroides odoratimimus]